MRKSISVETGLALLSGVILAIMIDLNSLLALHSDPFIGSWITHGVGTVASLGIIIAASQQSTTIAGERPLEESFPRWIYLGGIAGAFAVLLAAITVNGPLGLAGTLSLMLAGQLLFTLAVDRYGWLGMARRPITGGQLSALLLIVSGSLLIILGHPL